ncbi:transglycosylase domain-containing protein [Yunchengibacter salinarum]|uniref:transglycosylase domain-containing protein n=1 Tax=Yunchengibacter salinarum TaxID=3133399 RepID=UPI0035B68EAA
MIALGYLAHDMPDLDNLPAPGADRPSVLVKASNGATLVRTGPSYGDWVPFEALPDALVRALVAVEDRAFFEHPGVSITGVLRAMVANIRAGSVRAGGSTLTQQLAKNLFLSHQRTFRRKAQELLTAFWLEQKFTKRQLITLYLNRVYFGGGAYGVDAAARKYFGHGATRLSVAESALLAGLVKAPSSLAPHINPDGAWERARLVLSAMVETGALTRAAADKIASERPRILKDPVGAHVRYFTDWVTARARAMLPEEKGRSLTIFTTLDPAAQRAAHMAIRRGVTNEDGTLRHQGALVAMEPDGAVKAMTGGASYGSSQFNRATQARRQPGSAFKLFAYLAAIEQGMAADARFIDAPVTVDGWTPKNYSGQHDGAMTAREAFARSINTVAVRVAEKAGREKVAAMARRLGITTPIAPLPSLPLGTEEVRLIDLAGAYASVASGGIRAEPYGIVEITSMEGQVLYRRGLGRTEPVLARPHVRTITDMLSAVVSWGSGKAAALDRPVAGKTGTSQDSRDGVFVGFTSDLVTAVWVGHDDGTAMPGVTGGGTPARIFRDFNLEAHAGHPVRPLLADMSRYRGDERE